MEGELVRRAAALKGIRLDIAESCQLVKDETMSICAYSIGCPADVKLGW
jgi:hypothetical protein